MPDAALLDASSKILDLGVIGAACIFLMAMLAFVVRWLQSEQREHQKARDRWIEDLKEVADDRQATREAMSAMATALNQNTATMNTVVDLMRERQ